MGIWAAYWGILGACLILVFAIARLTPIAVETFDYPLAWYHWTLLAANLAFMAYYEGYRGFQLSFSPRVAQRAAGLRESATPLRALLAPLYCIGYFSAERRLQLTVVLLTLAIIVLVQLVHLLDQPWRGIVDAGVVVGLAWGLVSTLVSAWRYLLQSPEPCHSA